MITVTRALFAALAIALTACGGGDPEPLAGEFTVTATGGRADVAQTTLTVALPGPTVSLAAPAVVDVEITLDWQQSITAPAALAFSVTVDGASSAAQSAGMVTTAATRFASTHIVRVALPAGETALSGLGRVAATDAAGAPVGALAYFDLQATWRVREAN